MNSKRSRVAIESNGNVSANGVKVSARQVSTTAYGLSHSLGPECRQEMYLSLLENPPTAEQDTPAKVLTRMRFAALHERRECQKWEEQNRTPPTPDSDDAARWFERQPDESSEGRNPEDIFIGIEDADEAAQINQAVLEALPVETQQVAIRLMQGQRKGEIAQALEICPSAITVHIQTIRRVARRVIAERAAKES